MHELPRAVANTPVGKQVKIDILRQGKISTLTVTIAPLKEETVVSEVDVARQLGMEVTDLTAELSQNMGLRHERGSWSPLWKRGVGRYCWHSRRRCHLGGQSRTRPHSEGIYHSAAKGDGEPPAAAHLPWRKYPVRGFEAIMITDTVH